MRLSPVRALPSRALRALPLVVALVGLPALGAAQDGVMVNTGVPIGSPATGVNVPLRVENPNDSMQIFGQPQVAPAPSESRSGGQGASVGGREGAAANPFQQALERRARARGGDGDEGEGAMRDPFSSEQLAGIGRSGRGQESFTLVGADIYRGVTPNENDSIAHIARYQRRARTGASNELTWVGFQPFDDYTRVFIQTGRQAGHSVAQSPDGRTLTIRLPRTAIPLSNFRRPIDTSFFGRAVQEVRAGRGAQGEAQITIRLDRDARHAVQVQGNESGSYIFIDFYDRASE